MNNFIKLLVLASVFLIISSTSVLAFGISSPYWGGSNPNPLKMYPGETKDVYFNLQNCPSLSDYCPKVDEKVAVSFLEGSEIANLISGAEYLIPYGTADTYIHMQVSIPQCAIQGSSYNVEFYITTIDDENVIGVGYYVNFPVEVLPLDMSKDMLKMCKKENKKLDKIKYQKPSQ